MNSRGFTVSLEINPGLVEEVLVRFLAEEVRKAGFSRGVLGLSGGIDSSVSACLAARALGPENVTGLIMPYRTSNPESAEHAHLIARKLHINHETVDITPMIDAYFENRQADHIRRGNKMARERMSILYDYSSALKALVIGTSNKTELLLGYGTLHGDMASALNPVGDLYKTQLRQLARHLGVPEEIVSKHPSADLWAGQTDEEELGFSYEQVDRVLYMLVDERKRIADIIKTGFDEKFIDRIARMVRRSHFKRRLPVIAKISGRTVDRDFRYSRDWGT